MHPFEQFVYDRFARSIEAWDTEHHPDIYAIAFLIASGYTADNHGHDLSLQGTLSLAYNTRSHYETQIIRASRPEEAKWSTAYWPLQFSAQVPREFPYGGEPPIDELTLQDRWCASLGLASDSMDGAARPVYNELALYTALRELCVLVAQSLHQNGVIEKKFGRPIPIMIEQHENGELSAAATRAANPPGLSREAEEWYLGRSYAQIESYEALLQTIASRPTAEQVLFWRDLFLDLSFDRATEIAVRVREMQQTKYSVREILGTLGAAATPVLLSLVEEYALREQYRITNPHPLLRDGQWTTENWITESALAAIRKIGAADDAEVERLFHLLVLLHQDSIGKDWIGTNLSALASTLHALRPARFPQSQIGGRDNKLVNFAAFGLSAED